MGISLAKATTTDATKIFTDGVGQEAAFSKWLELIDFRITGEESLDVIDAWIELVEREDQPYLIVPNVPRNPRIGMLFRRTDEYLPRTSRTSIVCLDSDGESSDGQLVNTLDTRQKRQIAQDALLHHSPSLVLDGNGVRVRQSNKAGLSTYPHKIAIHSYIQLTEPRSYEDIYDAFAPWHGTKRLDELDTSTMHFNSAWFIRRPILWETLPGGKYKRLPSPISNDTGFYEPGKLFELNDIYDGEAAAKRKTQKAQINKSISTETTFEDAKETIEALADDGYFIGNRWSEHFRLIDKAEWVYGDALPMIELIETNHKILGDVRTRKDLEEKLQKIRKRNRLDFGCQIDGYPRMWNQDFAYKDEIDVLDLEQASLTSLIKYLDSAEWKTVLLCKSAHGTSKTNGLIKRLRDCLSKYLNRPLRELYICNRISNVSGSAKKLDLFCYIKEDGKTIHQFLYDQDNLAICLHSLRKLIDKNGERILFDIVYLDESESIALDAAWKNDNHNYLLDICESSTTTLMLDADLEDLSFSLARKISEKNGNDLAALFNRASHIKGKLFNIVDSEKDAYTIAQRLLDAGKRVYMHVDIADQEDDKRLTAIEDYFNIRYKQDIAIAIDSKLSKTKRYRGILSEPDIHLKEYLDKGYRLFIVSPVIETGWRYGGSKHFQGKLFDATVGIYRLGRHTAPTILQATQRCVGVSEHYLHIPRNCTYVDTNDYELAAHEAWRDEYESRQDVIDRRKVRAALAYSDAAQIQAQNKKDKMLSNVMLHMIYLLQDYDADIDFLSPLELSDGEQRIKALIKDEAMERFEYDAMEIFEDEEQRRHIANFFGLDEIYELETMIGLYRRQLKIVKNAADIEELIYTAGSSDDERREWGRYPYWKNSYSQDAAIPHYAQYGYVLDKMLSHVEDATGTNLMKMMHEEKPRSISFETSAINTPELTQAIKKYADLLQKKVGAISATSSTETIFRRILKDYLDLDVRGKTKKPNLAQAKREIIQDYMTNKIIPTRKDLQVNTNIRIVHRHIITKNAAGLEMTAAEEKYLEHTDKIMTVSLKDTHSKKIRTLLNMVMDYRDDEELPNIGIGKK